MATHSLAGQVMLLLLHPNILTLSKGSSKQLYMLYFDRLFLDFSGNGGGGVFIYCLCT